MVQKKKYAAIGNECVACGCCAIGCPLQAISIYRGIRAQVHRDRCVGCGKCVSVCPAQVVSLVAKEGE